MSESTTTAEAPKKTRGNNPLQPFMPAIFEHVIGPCIRTAYESAKADIEKKQAAGDEKATLTIGLICEHFNTLNEGCDVSASTFSKWMKECGYKSQRVTTIEPA